MSVAILLFILPPVLTWAVLARMHRSAADFLAGCAVLGGLAATFVPWSGYAMGAAPAIAIATTGAAWLLVKGDDRHPGRKAFACAVVLDLVALIVAVSRVLVTL